MGNILSDDFDQVVSGYKSPVCLLDEAAKDVGNILYKFVSFLEPFRFAFDCAYSVVTSFEQLFLPVDLFILFQEHLGIGHDLLLCRDGHRLLSELRVIL